MSCEHLICARCARPVVEGRCPVCREMRAESHDGFGGLSPMLVVFLLLLAVSLLAIASAAALATG